MVSTEENTPKAKASRRSRRSQSGAHTPCPICGKKLKGDKGLKTHVAAQHSGADQEREAA